MRTGVRAAAVAAAIVGAVVAALTVTPVGWRIAGSALEAAVRGNGLELTVGSLRGNLIRRVEVRGAELREPGGLIIARIDSLDAEYALGALLHKRVVVPKLRVRGAELLLVRGGDGRLVGWSRFGGPDGDPPRAARPSAWTVDALLDISGLRVALGDSAGTYGVEASDVAINARGGPRRFEASVSGGVALGASGLAEPVIGTFEARVGGGTGRVEIESARLASDIVDLASSGVVAGDSLHVAFDASVDLTALAVALGREDLGGAATVSGAVRAKAGEPAFDAAVAGSALVLGAVGVPELDAQLSGTPRALAVDRLRAAFADGSVDASGRVELPPRGTRSRPTVEFDVRARGIDLARVAASADGGAPVSGRLDLSARGRADSLSAAHTRASFAAEVASLGVGERDLGRLGLSGTLRDGRADIVAEGVGVKVVGAATVTDRGVASATVTAEAADLAVPAAAFGAQDVGGSGTVTARLTGLLPGGAPGGAARAAAEASFPVLTVGALDVGPATATAAGPLAAPTVTVEAFGGAVRASGTIDERGSYAFSAAADGLMLSWSASDTTRGLPRTSVELTASADVRGGPGGEFAALGTVERAVVAVGPETLSLLHPGSFAAGRDSVALSDFVLSGALGEIAVGGRLDAGGENDITLRLSRLELGRAAALTRAGEAASIGGTVDGAVTVLGSGMARRLSAAVEASELSVGGFAFDAVSVVAESDSEDVHFEVEAASRGGGAMLAYGAVPVRPDSSTVLVLDREREFGGTITWSRFTLVGGPELLPGVGGEKRLMLDGSILLGGTVDSLATLHGRGRFESLDVSFDRVAFSLVAPFDVEVIGGDVELPGTGLLATRRRTLGEASSGTAWLSGGVGRGGALALDLALERLDLGNLVSAFAPETGRAFGGLLDGRASVRGTFDAPEGEFAWTVSAPVIYGAGFTRLEGGGSFGPEAVVLDRVALTAPGGVIEAAGTVPLPPRDPAPSAPEEREDRSLDLRVRASSFELRGLASLPEGILDARGTLAADVAVTGPVGAPSLAGTMSLRNGSFRSASLAQPVKNVSADVAFEGDAVVLRDARASLGRGRVTASGFAEPLGPGARPFWLRANLESPEFSVPQTLDARLGGSVTWAGTDAASRLSGEVTVERLTVTQQVGLGDIMGGGPVRSVRPRADDKRARVALDVDVAVKDRIGVRSNLADLDLAGALHLGGTLLAPQLSGGMYAEDGTFRYLDNEFVIENLNVSFTDPRRQDPYVDLLGTASVVSRSREEYDVTLRVTGFAFDALPELSSAPPLSEPDVLALLTFGDTVGELAAGGGAAVGSSGERLGALTRKAFLGSLFGVAESTMERLLDLDTVELDREAAEAGDLAGAELTLGKRFGDRLRVDYRTALGKLDQREVDISLKLTRTLSLETRADPEGNHAVGLRASLLFE